MAVNYGVLRGKVIAAIPYNSGTDHFQVEIKDDNGTIYRIAIDVYSMLAGKSRHYSTFKSNVLDTSREVMYYKDENYKHPVTALMLKCNTGFTAKNVMDSGLYLDYSRTNPQLFPINDMVVVEPKNANGEGDDLNDDIGPWINKALNNADAEVFAFGSGWDDNATGGKLDTKAYFNPNPSLGIHDIHMNQGDTGSEAKYNGTYQDGALFIHFISEIKWVAMFFRFQNQNVKTDVNGNPL